MFFTMDEVALIDGLIATYFVAESVSESVRVRYYETHQHLQDNRTDYVDLRNIKEALFFLAPLFQIGYSHEITEPKRKGGPFLFGSVISWEYPI